MLERFTTQARATVVRAREEVQLLRQAQIGTEHLLLGLLDEHAGIAYDVLHEAGLDRDQVRAEVRRLAGAQAGILSEEDAAALRSVGIDLDAVLARIEETFGPHALEPRGERHGQPGQGLLRRKRGHAVRMTPAARKALELGLREAVRLGSKTIGTEHLLLGLIRGNEGRAARILVGAGQDPLRLRVALLDAMDEAA